jgi:TolA-binding protein
VKLKLTTIEDRMEVLKLRLQVAQALLQGEEAAAALGARLLTDEQKLSVTTPSSLALMCDAAVDAGDVVQMQRLYDYFIANYEESDQLWHAYRAKTFMLLAKEDYWGVLAAIDEAQGMFGAEAFMGWAQITKADTLMQMKKFEEAEEAFNMVMGVPEWRGPIFAEAMYGMGLCRLAREDYATAHSFFQRTYLLFKSYSDGEWAAKGYLAAADCLLKLDREEEAIRTLNAMLEDDYTNTRPEAEQVRAQLKKYGGA